MLEKIEVEIVNKSDFALPSYSSLSASGLDIRANLKGDNKAMICSNNKSSNFGKLIVTMAPFSRKLIPTGIFVSISLGYELQVRPRSGLALREGLTVLNTPGTIDADYRGEIGVILINNSSNIRTIAHGDRIAQLVLSKVEQVKWKEVNELDSTIRGEGGFGHTGIK